MRRYSHDSQNAALAAWAAWDQGKFWEMHDLLFEKAPELDRSALDELARQLGLDMARYKKAMDEQTHLPELQENLDRIHELDIWSTPTTIINGRVIKGAQPYENYKKIIEEALGKSSRRQMSSSFLSNILMDSQKVHQAVPPPAGLGVGATPVVWGGFTSLPRSRRGGTGGGSRLRRDRPSDGSKRLLARLSILEILSVVLTPSDAHAENKVFGQGKVPLYVRVPDAKPTNEPKLGDQAPDFTLPSVEDTWITLSDFRGSKNVLLSFMPAAFTPV